ncbi:MAG: PDZ domain-containing protein [Deltaproteobacteria bacterium]|nr:PDZ domain-containing protein [Deltaproteobacteria bacterium]
MVGSLLAALGLTAMGDTYAQAQRTDPRKHARLVPDQDATELRVLDWTLWNVSKYYVEPDRIDPQAMTLAALEALEQDIAEVLVQPTADGKKVHVRVGTAERDFNIGDVEALWAVGPHVREVFDFVNDNTKLDEDEQRNAEYAIVAGVLSTLDPHTNLLRPEDFEEMQASTKGSFGGLGIEVGMRDGAITVLRVIEDNPASKVDMLPGDRIVQIDAESTVTMNLNDAVGRLRGPAGTPVTVYVMRDGLQRPLPLKITRATIQLDSVIGDVLEDVDAQGNPRRVGLVQIPRNFSQNTGQELRAKLSEFEQQKVSGVILDLRGNPGGLLNAAVDVSDAFLSSGNIVSTVGVASPRKESRADSRYDFPDLPLVVLIDQGSASASEIVAGALRNRGRAVLLGRRSFGKGSVQELRDRKVGDKELALKLTVAQYLTPGDVSIQSVGVAPDVETVPVWVSKDHVQYFGKQRFDLLREESLSAHLESDKAEQLKRSPFSLHFLDRGSLDPNQPDKKTDAKSVAEQRSKAAPPREADKDSDVDKRTAMLLDDPEIRMARDMVVWAPSSNRDAILGKMDQFVKTQRAGEQQRITASLAARDIDWSRGPKPEGGAAKLRVAMSSDKTGNTIKGGDKGIVTVTVTNDGDAPAYQVRAITDSDYRYFDERELIFGRIEPGASKKYEIKLAVGENERSRTDRIDLHLFEQHGAKLAAKSQTSIDISAQGLPRPQFAFGYQILDLPTKGTKIDGNGDGIWQVGERVHVRVHVTNKGEGSALDTWINLRNLSDDAVFIHEGRQRLEKLAVGETRMVDLDAELRHRPRGGQARVQLSVSDTKVGEALSEKLLFPVPEGSNSIPAERGVVITRNEVDLYASPGPDHRVASAAAGERFRSTGQTNGWVRLDLGEGGFAFARQDEVDSGKGKAKSPGKHTPILEVSPPKIMLTGAVTQTEDDALHLSGSVSDEARVQDVFITVANPSRDLFAKREKVFYEASSTPGSGQLDFTADVPLTPGNNLIEVYAREDDDVVAVRRMWVLRTSGLAEARAKDGSFESNGKLSVDTFR